MKVKKLLLLAAAGLVMLTATGCQKQRTESTLTKSQVIKKAAKPFKSGQLNQYLTLSNGTQSQKLTQATVFGGQNAIFHTSNQLTNGDKQQTIDSWLTSNQFYINGRNTWYHADSQELLGYTYADMSDTIFNNQLLLDPSASLTKAYKLKHKGSLYTLTATVTDKQTIKDEASAIMGTIGQTAAQTKLFNRLTKAATFQKMTVTTNVQNGKLAGAKISLTGKIGHSMTLNLRQVYGNLGQHEFLKLPQATSDAKALPKEK